MRKLTSGQLPGIKVNTCFPNSPTGEKGKSEKWPPVQVDIKNSQAWRSSTNNWEQAQTNLKWLKVWVYSICCWNHILLQPITFMYFTSSNISPIQMVKFPVTFLLPQGTILQDSEQKGSTLDRALCRSGQTKFPKSKLLPTSTYHARNSLYWFTDSVNKGMRPKILYQLYFKWYGVTWMSTFGLLKYAEKT